MGDIFQKPIGFAQYNELFLFTIQKHSLPGRHNQVSPM